MIRGPVMDDLVFQKDLVSIYKRTSFEGEIVYLAKVSSRYCIISLMADYLEAKALMLRMVNRQNSIHDACLLTLLSYGRRLKGNISVLC